MPQQSSDPTAGRRARLIGEQRDVPLLVIDPTDPRYGDPQAAQATATIEDPTDTRWGEAA